MLSTSNFFQQQLEHFERDLKKGGECSNLVIDRDFFPDFGSKKKLLQAGPWFIFF